MTLLDDSFSTGVPAPVQYPDIVTVPGILNTHGHPRDTDAEGDGRAEMNIPLAAEVYEEEIGIGNTYPPLITPERGAFKKAQWNALVPKGRALKIHVAGLINEDTTPEQVLAGYDKPDGEEDFLSMKMFLRAASNAHGADVNDVSKIIPVLKAMTNGPFVHKKRPMTLSVHAERKYDLQKKRILFLNREQEAVDRDIAYILHEVPGIRLVICHVSLSSTINAIRHWRSLGYNVYGELCPHYSMWTCDDLFEGPNDSTMLDVHKFCLPIFKTETDRVAVLEAMLSGELWWLFGSDGACWIDNPTKGAGVKVNSLGYVFGGQTQIPRATVSYVIEKFVEARKLEHLAGYLSHNGRDAFGLPRSTSTISFKHYLWTVEEKLYRTSETLGKLEATVAMRGQLRQYVPVTSL